MSDNSNKVEQHGCIVCGRLHNLLVVYGPDGRMLDCTVTSPGGRIVPDPRPLVACESHTEEQVRRALALHYPGKAAVDPDDD